MNKINVAVINCMVKLHKKTNSKFAFNYERKDENESEFGKCTF